MTVRIGTEDVSATTPRPDVPATEGAPAAPASGLRIAVSLVCLLAVMLRVTIHAASPLDNSDTWFHLRIGHELLGPWSLRHPGQLSSFGDVAWLPTQWSTEILAAAVESRFGLPGVAWLFGGLYLALVVSLYVLCRRRAEPLPATVATGLAVIGTTAALSARPQVVTLLMLVIVVSAWLRAQDTHRVPWVLVPLTWVWATAHGMWTVGVVIGVVCCVGLALDRAVTRRRWLGMALVPVLSVVAACLTPLGPRLLLTQIAVGQRAPLIGEWAATSFREIPAFVVAAMIGVVVLRWSLRGRRVPWLQVLLLMLACGWVMLVGRMVACGAVMVAPLLASALQEMVTPEPSRPGPGRGERLVLAAGTLLLLVGLALAVPHTASRPGGVPAAFGDRLAELPAGTPVAVEDATGAWIEWRYPGLDPVVDGMLDAYPVDYIRDYADFVDVEPGWTSFLARSRARVAVVRSDSPLSDAMRRQLHWRALQRTGRWVYLVAPEGSGG